MNNLLSVYDVLNPVWNSNQYEIMAEDEGLFKVAKEPIFIHPQLKEIQKKENSNFILISAPGAVGKTTFAKFATFKKKGYYLDLAKIKLGSNTFVGTLAKYFGPQNLSKVLQDISNGDVSFFIDAFDEAEIISGWDGVYNFIKEVNDYCKNSLKSNIIFFSRSETAAWIKMELEDLVGTNEFSMYEIEYFDEDPAIQFIEMILKEKKDKNVDKHKLPLQQACKMIFNVIGKGIDSDCTEIWENDEIRSFIGYSPVLQTIGNYLFEENFEEIRKQFEVIDSQQGGLDLISNFIDHLLHREQGKFTDGLKQKINSSAQAINWDAIFDINVQLKLLVNFLFQGDYGILSIPHPEVPKIIENEYLESLIQFLPNHPFLRSGKFSSPAFRDYTLALLMQDGINHESCKSYMHKSAIILTPLFAHFYSKFSSKKCIGPHVGFIYESIISRKGVDDNVILTYINRTQSNYLFEVINTEKVKTDHFIFDCIINDQNPLVFERRLNHATISINEDIVLGRTGNSIELCDVELRARKIIIAAKQCVLNCHGDDSIYLQADSFKQEDPSLSLKKYGDCDVKVCWPDSLAFPWSDYRIEQPIKIDADCSEHLYNLKKILFPFRKHGRTEFAKQQEFIDNVIVNTSRERRLMRDYLLQKGVLTYNRSTSQYFMHPDVINKHGFTWSDIKTISSNDALLKFVKAFQNTLN